MSSFLKTCIPLLCFLTGVVIALPACSGVSSEDPPLADSTFSRVLVDLHLTTARGRQFTDLPANVQDSIFAHHDVEPAEFDATLRYYTRHPVAFESLYNGVIDTLKALEESYRNQPSIPDSLQGRRGE